MNDQTISMTLTAPDGTTIGPVTSDDLTAAAAQVVEPLTAQAAEAVIEQGKCSASFLQRLLGIGYNRAARIIEALEDMGIVTAADHVGKREVAAQKVPDSLAKAAIAQKTTKIPMKETPEDRDIRDKVYGVAAGELRSFIERFERLEAEKKDIADQQKEVMAEAKSRGYDTKVMRKVIALRKRDPDDLAEEETVLEMYKAALGMA